jgi:hypothetical protein
MKPAETHKCNAPDCQRQILTSRAFCTTHWRLIPASMRTRINAHWASYCRPNLSAKDKLRVGLALRDAVKSAREYLQKSEAH